MSSGRRQAKSITLVISIQKCKAGLSNSPHLLIAAQFQSKKSLQEDRLSNRYSQLKMCRNREIQHKISWGKKTQMSEKHIGSYVGSAGRLQYF